MSSSPLRILYAAGPGDVVGTYRHWLAGRDDPAQVAVTYSGQFYQLCQDLDAWGYVISTNHRHERIVENNFIIEHRPLSFERGPGWLFHWGRIWYGVKLAISAVRFRANVAIVSDGAIHWFMLGLMRLFGIKVIPTIHCVLWPRNRQIRGTLGRFFFMMNGWFFAQGATAILSLSNEITQQVRSLMDGAATPIIPFLPTYRPESFGQGLRAPTTWAPFRVFFAGRIERNKGVFDLLEIARGFGKAGHTDIEFDLCGDGSQLAELRKGAIEAGVATVFRCHGHCDKEFMSKMFELCHVVIVPTTADFMEGFNKVVAEGILAGRPVITSAVCPALEYVRPGVVEVAADNAGAYGVAILQLKEDGQLYEAKRNGCNAVRGQFYDISKGWAAAARRAIELARG